MSAINDQKQTRSQGWGKPCRRRYALVPARCEQACRDGGPSGFRPLFDVLPDQLGGGFGRRHFSRNSSLRGSLPCKGDRPHGLLPQGWPVANPTHGGPSRGAHVAAPVSRCLNLNSAHHIACKLADVPESHLKRLSCAGFDANEPSDTKGQARCLIQTIRMPI